MVNVAADIDEVRDVLIAPMPRLYNKNQDRPVFGQMYW